MAEDPRPAEPAAEASDSTDLVAVLLEIERYVGGAGWDQPTRLFALVATDRLLAAEPGLADQLRRGGDPAQTGRTLTGVEQEHFATTGDLVDDLAGIEWPDTVDGCAVAVERFFLPAGSESQLPADPAAAAELVAAHPDRQEIRVVVGVDRDGRRHGVARLRTRPDELLGAANLVPGLAEALAHTLT
jgi:hypothetical protein